MCQDYDIQNASVMCTSLGFEKHICLSIVCLSLCLHNRKPWCHYASNLYLHKRKSNLACFLRNSAWNCHGTGRGFALRNRPEPSPVNKPNASFVSGSSLTVLISLTSARIFPFFKSQTRFSLDCCFISSNTSLCCFCNCVVVYNTVWCYLKVKFQVMNRGASGVSESPWGWWWITS